MVYFLPGRCVRGVVEKDDGGMIITLLAMGIIGAALIAPSAWYHLFGVWPW
jgi:hypothetical protein